MTLRRRISIAAAAAAAAAMLVAIFACYMILRSELRGQVDDQLRAQATAILKNEIGLGQNLPTASASDGGAAQITQVVLVSGRVTQVQASINGRSSKATPLPDIPQSRQIALRHMPATLQTVEVGGHPFRMYTFPAYITTDGGATVQAAIELARPLSSVNAVLTKMRLILLLLLLLGIVLATVLGRLAARRVLSPITELTETAQLIGETDDLSRRIHVTDDDEVGRMATRFNEMLERLSVSRDALDASVTAQRQLVADASHELRTPVTSLRTNIEVLLEDAVIDEEDRRRLLTDVVEQSEELTALVADLIEVARGDLPADSIEDTRLDVLVDEALQRARRNNPTVEFTAELAPVAVHGHPERLTRAINNLLDNAAKHNAPGQPVEVTVTPSALAVRDHGGGIDPSDLPHVFDRFYRGINSRSRQGSGLGLAIVKQVAEQHGGSVAAANAATGGAVFTFRLPGVAVSAAEAAAPHGAAPPPAGPAARSTVTDDAPVPGDLKTTPQ